MNYTITFTQGYSIMNMSISPWMVSLRLLFLSLPLLLNDFYLPLVPEDAVTLDLVLDVIIYIGWQTSIIYMAWQAGWFTFSDIGFKREGIGREVLLGLGLLVIVFVTFILVLLVGMFIDLQFGLELSSRWYFPVPENWHPAKAFLYVFYLSITAGVFEEIIYRGIVIRQLDSVTRSDLLKVVLSTLLFVLIHWSMGPQTWIEAGLFGALWAYIFIRTDSLVPNIVAHFLYDLITIYGLHDGIINSLV